MAVIQLGQYLPDSTSQALRISASNHSMQILFILYKNLHPGILLRPRLHLTFDNNFQLSYRGLFTERKEWVDCTCVLVVPIFDFQDRLMTQLSYPDSVHRARTD